MDSKKFKLVLAMTVLAVPLTMGGCGASEGSTPIDTEPTVAESVTESTVSDTIEEDLADAGVTVTPTPEATPTPEVNEVEIDTSMADTYYVIAEEGIPFYAENDTASEVLGTLAYDSEVTSLGMSTETNLFQIELADGTTAWVESGNLDVIRGGYQETMNETPESEPQVDNPSDVADSGSQSDTDTSESTTPQASTSLPSDSNSGYMTDEEIAAMLGITLPDDYDSSGYDPYAPVPEFEMDWDTTGGTPHTVQ